MTIFTKLAMTGLTFLVACAIAELFSPRGTRARTYLPYVAWPSLALVMLSFLGALWSA